jgi:hypothetical protein
MEVFPAARLLNGKLVETASPVEAEIPASAGPSSSALGAVVGFRRRAEGAAQGWVAQQPPVVVVLVLFPISPRSVRAGVPGLASLLLAEAVTRSLPPARVARAMVPAWMVQ